MYLCLGGCEQIADGQVTFFFLQFWSLDRVIIHSLSVCLPGGQCKMKKTVETAKL